MYVTKEHETERGKLLDKPDYFRLAQAREQQPNIEAAKNFVFYTDHAFRRREWNDHYADVFNENLSLARRQHHFDYLGSLMWEEITNGNTSVSNTFAYWMREGGI